MAVLVFVIFLPIALTPTSRTILYFVCACLCAILFGSRVKAQCSLNIAGVCFTTSGAVAVLMGVMFVLHQFTVTPVSIGIYNVCDSYGNPVQLLADSCSCDVGGNGSSAQLFIKGNTILTVFPHGEESASVRLAVAGRKEQFSSVLVCKPGKPQTITLKSLTIN